MLPPRFLLASYHLLVSHRFRVEGESMLPTLSPGQHVLARPTAGPRPGPDRGDIVVLRHPQWGQTPLIKRVVGRPQEYIHLRDDGVHIDDQDPPLRESYLAGPPCPDMGHPRHWFTGPEEYFVMGDNRSDSLDSRTLGPVPSHCILGLVWLRCWPPTAWGKVAGKPGGSA